MNQDLENYARTKILSGLVELPESWQEKFKLMYGRSGGKRSVEETIALPIEDVVKNMDADRLDWALTQVENSFKSLAKS